MSTSVSGTLNVVSQAVAYGDGKLTSNPSRVFWNWTRRVLGLAVGNPQSFPMGIDAGASTSIFNGSRTLATDATTVFSIARNPVNTGLYRLTSIGGTSPAFRTARAVATAGVTLSFSDNLDGSATLAADSGIFGAVQAGDMLFVPGVTTGDAALVTFSPNNEGFWTVLAATGSSLILTRLPGELFSVANEGKLATANSLQVFSAAGAQAGDKLTLSAGFAPVALKTYPIVNVTASWVEIGSTTPIPAQSGILPGATGVSIYTSLKQFIRVEADQECVVQLNGDTGSSVRLSPVMPGDEENVGWLELRGAIWSVQIVNLAQVPLKGKVFSAE